MTTGWTVWLTGLPASGKTVLAYALQARLAAAGMAVVVLDSDAIRRMFMPAAAYTLHERDQFYRRLVDLAASITRTGANVIIAATGHRRAYRQLAREQLIPFAEVWIRCPIEVCRARDPKQLYARADAGIIDQLPGVGVPYEPPDAPEAIIDTDQHTVEESVDLLIDALPFLRSADSAVQTTHA